MQFLRAGSISSLALAPLLCAFFALSGCSSDSDERLFERRFLSFGTLVEVSFYDASPPLAAKAAEAMQDDFDFLDRSWRPWEPGPLKRVNTLLQTGAWISVGPAFPDVLTKAKDLSLQSGGLFNPAIGRLVALWGFNEEDLAGKSPPPQEQVAKLAGKAPAMDDLEIDGIRLRSHNPYVYLDFGGYLPGYAADRLAERLKAMGIANAVVNAGGEVHAYGRHGARPWRIGIRDPRGPGVSAYVDIEGEESVVTSGDYEHYFEHGGRRYCHIIDPRTGYPAEGVRSVTVVHPSAGVGEAATKAFFLTPTKDWLQLQHRMGVEQVMMVDGEGTVHVSARMAKRLHFVAKPPPKVVVEGADKAVTDGAH